MAVPARRIPTVRGAADVQLSRTSPGQITARHKGTGTKIGVITPSGRGYAARHTDGTVTGASGGQQGALAGLIAHHNAQAAKTRAGVNCAAGTGRAVTLAAASSTPANTVQDGPRITTAGGGKDTETPSGLSPYAAGVYKKLLAKGMRPGVALAFARRADALHEKDA